MIIALDSERPHHRRALRFLATQLMPVFEKSSEGVFLYLDSEHKVCNERLADMFGYTTFQWEEVYPFESIFAKEDRKNVMATFYEKIFAEKAPGELLFSGVKKDGSLFNARLLMVPLSFEGLIFALCFVKSEKST